MTGQIIRSGAFLQQCWSVHPLCLTTKRVTDDRTLIMSCTSCKSVHYLTLGLVVTKDSGMQRQTGVAHSTKGISGGALLGACIAAHHASVTLREMDVFQDLVLLRCADCRRHYKLTISFFETHQK